LHHHLGDRKHYSVQNQYLLLLIPDLISLSEARKRNPDRTELPGQVMVQFGAAGLRLWEVNTGQREALGACLAGRGTARRFYPRSSAFVPQQFPWCPCFVCRLVCRQHSSWTCHTRWFYEAVHRVAWLCCKAVAPAARHQPPQTSCRLCLTGKKVWTDFFF